MHEECQVMEGKEEKYQGSFSPSFDLFIMFVLKSIGGN